VISNGDFFPVGLVGLEKLAAVSDKRFILFRRFESSGDAVFDLLLHLHVHVGKPIINLIILTGELEK